jgi:hypothetical protein
MCIRIWLGRFDRDAVEPAQDGVAVKTNVSAERQTRDRILRSRSDFSYLHEALTFSRFATCSGLVSDSLETNHQVPRIDQIRAVTLGV